jgi:hypothetical protein
MERKFVHRLSYRIESLNQEIKQYHFISGLFSEIIEFEFITYSPQKLLIVFFRILFHFSFAQVPAL